MNDFKLFARCEACGKKRFYIAKREVKLPIGPTAKSQKLLCGRCYIKVQEMLATNTAL